MNLIFIDSRLNSLNTFIDGCNENTKVIIYEVHDNFNEINEKIQNLGISSFNHVGFIFDNDEENILKLFVSYNPFISFDESGIKDNLTTQFIKEVVTTYNVETIDFLACDLLLNDKWRSYFEYLQNQSSDKNLIVRASNNKSGNLQHGGDWILESTNEDITNLYFNETIGQWSHLLGITGSNPGHYNTILLNDDSNNIYTCSIADNGNQDFLLRVNGDFRNSEYFFNKNIISISSTNDSFAFLTDETSNNLYVLGTNGASKFGFGNSNVASLITNVTINILNKKVIQVCLSRSHRNDIAYVMYVLTDESLNNLYVAGSNGFNTIGLGTNTSHNTLQRVTYLNQKILMISSNAYDGASLITDEPSNNVYYINSNTKNLFIKIDNLFSFITTNSSVDNNWTSICWSPELQLFCAVANSGTGNRVMTSSNGINWVTRTSSINNNWTSICWSPGLQLFCAVANSGTGNRVMTSSDGINWVTRTSSIDNSWTSICWSPELQLFCAVANSGTGNRVMTSSDGINWVTRTSSIDNSWTSICWSPGLQLFCAVANTGTGNRVMTSSDGINWVTRTSSIDNSWTSICWSPGLQLFCAVANSGTGNRVMTSSDGINWVTRTTAINNSWTSISWSPELQLFCAVANSGTGERAMTSPDGINWVTRTSVIHNSLSIYNNWTSVCWSPVLQLFCAVSNTGTGDRAMISYTYNATPLYNTKAIYIQYNLALFILTNESSNNFYVFGNNSWTNNIGLGSITSVSQYTKVSTYSTELLNKKVEKIFMENSISGNVYFALTDETSNNLYACGNNTSATIPLCGIDNNNITTFQNVSKYSSHLLNKKVIDLNVNNRVTSLITNESSNNLYSTGSYSGYTFGNILTNSNGSTPERTFKNIAYDTSIMDEISYPPIALTSTQIISGQPYGNGKYNILASSIYENTSPAIPYGAFDKNYGGYNAWVTSLGKYSSTTKDYLGSVSTYTTDNQIISGEWIQIELPESIKLSKLKIFSRAADASPPSAFTLVANNNITDTWNILFNCDDTLNPFYSGDGTWGAGKTIFFNIYSSLFYKNYRIICKKTTVQQYITIGELELISNPTTNVLNKYNELFNKKVKLIGGYHESPNISIAITDELSSSTVSNIYICGGLNNNYSIYNSLLYFKKMKYPILNKKFTKVIRNNYIIFAISDESKNNLYYCNGSGMLFTNRGLMTNLSLLQSSITDKKIIDVSVSRYFGYFLTDETSNNLYGVNTYGTNLMGDGTSNSSYDIIKKINNNIVNKKIIKISNNSVHKGLLTDEPSNNYYVCGLMNNNNNGAFGNGSLSGSYNVFTNVTTGIISGKKFIDIDCGSDDSVGGNLSTFLVSNESSNNLYGCGKGYLGNGINNTSGQSTFLNITTDIFGKKIIKVMRGGNQVAILTDEEPIKRDVELLSNISMLLTSINSYSTIKSSAYSPTLNRIVCLSKYGGILYSDNAGTTWNSFTNLSNMSVANNIIWVSKTQEFYIIGNANLVAKSSNGINWTFLTTMNYSASENQSTIEWSPELEIFCTTKGNGLYNIIYSTNGINWSTAVNPTPDVSKYGVKWIKELNKFYAISQSTIGNKCLVYSSNGINWTIGGVISNVNYEYIYDITWSKELNKICLILERTLPSTARTVHSCTSINEGLTWTISDIITTYVPGNSNTYRSNLLWNPKIKKFMFGIFDAYESSDGINWTKTQYGTKSSSYCYIHMNHFTEIDKIIISSDFNYIHLPIYAKRNNLYMVGTGGTGTSNTLTTFTNISNGILANKTIIDIDCDNGFTNVFTNESSNNIYVTGSNTFGNLGTKNKISLTDNFERLTYLNNRSYMYVPPVESSSVPVIINSTPTITDSSGNTIVSTPVKYAPKAVNIGNNNKITFTNPINTTINIAPVQTVEAVQKYESVLNISPKNVVSGYIKLEPAGTTFENHISLEFDVDPFIQPVVYFKSSTDLVPILIPSSNNSTNNVYYTANTSTGSVTLYTKHFSEAIVTQDQSTINPPLNFTLSNFDTSLAMGLSGELFKEQIPLMDASAIAEYYVKTSDMKKVFVFQTDSKDINNDANQDVKYFVRINQWPNGLVLNPCHAWVQTSKQIANSDKHGLIPDNRQLVKHDFIRYIAKSLFNTHLAVDLFQNENELNYDLAYKGHNSAWNSIWNSMTSISDVSLNTSIYNDFYGIDLSYGYYLTNDLSNNSNICRQLLNQVINTAPGRIQNITSYAIDISSGLFSVPLMDGDSISFKLNLQTAPNQHLLLNSATPIPPRSYQIRVNLVNTVTSGTTHQTGTNLIVNDTLPDTYLGSVPTINLNNSYPANYI
jgi:hypothetical protein